VAGFDISGSRDAVRRCIGIVFQEPALDIKLTGRENLEFHAMMYGMGLIFASNMRDMQGFSIVMNFVIFPLFFLSGALYPLENFPGWLRAAAQIDPLTYGVDGLRAALIGISTYPAALDAALMAAFSLLMIFFGVYFFEKNESV